MTVTSSGKYNFDNKEFTQMPSVASIARDIRNHLGAGMAEKEWQDDPNLANKKFLHIDAYHKFLDEDTLILLGRTGTGKTSILRSIEYNISNNICDDYTHVILDDFAELFNVLLNQSVNESEVTTMTQMETIIDTSVVTMVMIHMVNKYNDSEELKKVKSYLKDNNLYSENKKKNFLKKVLHSFRTDSEGKVAEVRNSVADIYGFIKNILSTDYNEAKDELIAFLADKKVLVLFDSLNHYNICEKDEVLAVKALISTCFNYYINNATTHIYLKIALPSEVHTRILDSLPGKQQGNTVLIQWKYKELISFVALRFFFWLKDTKSKKYKLNLSFSNDFDFDDFFLSNDCAYEKSKELFKNFLPETCPTCFIFEFDTMSYCIRHTLKKPRELLMIFNALIEEVIAQKNIQYFIDNPHQIKNSVHSTQELMVKSALSMYETSYPGINQACFVVLDSCKFVFNLSNIQNKLKEAEQQNSCEIYDKKDILRVLFESGLVGVVNEIRHINKPSQIFKTEEPFDFIIANFEYQIKGKITPTQNDQYVIHPMCYEYFRCLVDNCSMVYPDRFADEEDIISTILKQ